MIEIQGIQIRGDLPHGLLVSWSIAETSEDLSLYSFQVLRGGGPAGPFSPISPELNGRLSFFDQQADQAHRKRGLFYKVKAIRHAPQREEALFPKDDSAYLTAPSDLLAQELAFRFGAQLYVHAGRRVLIFPAKREGKRCVCQDTIRGRPMRSDCPSCFGTGYAGGFWNPILVPVKIFEGQTIAGPAPSGKNGMMQLAIYPIIGRYDLIVEAEGTRWRVPETSSIKFLRHARAPYQQHVNIVKVAPNDVLYSIGANFDGVEVAPEARFLRRMH